MTRKDKHFPAHLDKIICSYLKNIWEKGWLDDYSEEHFLIKAIENKLTDFIWYKQFINNNLHAMYSVLSTDGKIDYERFSTNFCFNFSCRLQGMSKIFGEEKIKKFIIDQLSAGKQNYKEDSFFQAFSEIEVLTFFHRGFDWEDVSYEPAIGINGENPEAYFIGKFSNLQKDPVISVKANIEVKTPEFPKLASHKAKTIVPSVMLTNEGRTKLSQLCDLYDVELILPRVTKLVDFINSAAKKFDFPKENEYNLLYINLSYCDFPSNSFLEAWSLLTNPYNGILTHPEIGTTLPFNKPINPDAYKKITAVIVYSSSIDQLMFCNFRHVWERNGQNCKFRMFVLDKKLKEAELSNQSDLLFRMTGMNPDTDNPHVLLANTPCKNVQDQLENDLFLTQAYKITTENALLKLNK